MTKTSKIKVVKGWAIVQDIGKERHLFRATYNKDSAKRIIEELNGKGINLLKAIPCEIHYKITSKV